MTGQRLPGWLLKCSLPPGSPLWGNYNWLQSIETRTATPPIVEHWQDLTDWTFNWLSWHKMLESFPVLWFFRSVLGQTPLAAAQAFSSRTLSTGIYIIWCVGCRGLVGGLPPPPVFLACPFENSYEPAFLRTLNPPFKNFWIRPCFIPPPPNPGYYMILAPSHNVYSDVRRISSYSQCMSSIFDVCEALWVCATKKTRWPESVQHDLSTVIRVKSLLTSPRLPTPLC